MDCATYRSQDEGKLVGPTPEVDAASAVVLALSIAFIIIANKVQRGATPFRF